jgi:hypothetical protein
MGKIVEMIKLHMTTRATLPKLTPHIPLYDGCPHRGAELDRTGCGCIAFACKLHGVVSTQPRSGLKLCQKLCPDFPK